MPILLCLQIKTPMSIGLQENPKMVEFGNQIIPMGRGGEAIEIARIVLFLASDDASYITGQGQSLHPCPDLNERAHESSYRRRWRASSQVCVSGLFAFIMILRQRSLRATVNLFQFEQGNGTYWDYSALYSNGAPQFISYSVLYWTEAVCEY